MRIRQDALIKSCQGPKMGGTDAQRTWEEFVGASEKSSSMATAHEIILVTGVLCPLAILARLLSAQIGTPLLLVFIGVGMLADEDGPEAFKLSKCPNPRNSPNQLQPLILIRLPRLRPESCMSKRGCLGSAQCLAARASRTIHAERPCR